MSAIQKRSSAVRQILEAVKTEASKYGVVLDKVREKPQEASKTIDDVAVRRRAITALRTVGNVPDEQTGGLLKIESAEVDEGMASEEESDI